MKIKFIWRVFCFCVVLYIEAVNRGNVFKKNYNSLHKTVTFVSLTKIVSNYIIQSYQDVGNYVLSKV